MHPALLNGDPKVTIIESFKGEVSVIRSGFRKTFKNLHDAQKFIADKKWEINVEIIKGSPLLRNMVR